MTPITHTYQPREILAIDPRAWGMGFSAHDRDVAPFELINGVAVVNVRGPLTHHAGWWSDSYDEIKARVVAALESKPAAVVLSLDSPGGLVSGCFDTAAEIRAAALAAGVPLYAYVDGSTMSAAYALACAAERIVAPPTGNVGSIGVIDMLFDLTARNAAEGVATRIVASGSRKADGNPNQPIAEDAVEATLGRVDYIAGLFFEHVAQARGVSVDEVRALEGAVLVGATAVPMLVDEVLSLDQMLAAISGGTFGAGAPEKETDMKLSAQYDEAIKTLRSIAEGEDKDEAAKAKKMLAAMEGDEEAPGDKEPDGDEPKGEGDDEDHKEPDGDEAKAAARVQANLDAYIAAQAKATAKASEDAERKTLLASRPDLDEPTRALLAASPIEAVRDFVSKAARKALKPAATAVVQSTTPEGLGDGNPPPTEQLSAIRLGMGHRDGAVPHMDGRRQVFPQMTRAEGVKWLEARARNAAKGQA